MEETKTKGFTASSVASQQLLEPAPHSPSVRYSSRGESLARFLTLRRLEHLRKGRKDVRLRGQLSKVGNG